MIGRGLGGLVASIIYNAWAWPRRIILIYNIYVIYNVQAWPRLSTHVRILVYNIYVMPGHGIGELF
jgi:hypothetical protein